jgi:hypothetical protein
LKAALEHLPLIFLSKGRLDRKTNVTTVKSRETLRSRVPPLAFKDPKLARVRSLTDEWAKSRN